MSRCMNQCIDVQPQTTPPIEQPQFTVTPELYEKLGSKIDMYGGLAIVGLGTAVIAGITKHEANKLERAIKALQKDSASLRSDFGSLRDEVRRFLPPSARNEG